MIAVTQENSCGSQQAIPVGEVLDLQQVRQENQTLRCERNYYKSLLERAIAREELLKQEIQQLNARIRYLEKRLYSRKSEKKTCKAKVLSHFPLTRWLIPSQPFLDKPEHPLLFF